MIGRVPFPLAAAQPAPATRRAESLSRWSRSRGPRGRPSGKARLKRPSGYPLSVWEGSSPNSRR
jgi:hypothetical protein